MKVGTGLVFAKPTVIPTIGYDIQRLVFAKPTVGFPIWGLKHGWFPLNQPSFQPWVFLYDGRESVSFGLIFRTKQLSMVGPVREELYRTITNTFSRAPLLPPLRGTGMNILKSRWNNIECKIDSCSGAFGGASETLRQRCHAVKKIP